jgi:hypothetical protein
MQPTVRRDLLVGVLLSIAGALLHALCIPDALRERSDLAHYLESAARWALDGAAPYREIPFEYPPAALLLLRLPVELVSSGLLHFESALTLVLAPFDALALFSAFWIARVASMQREQAGRGSAHAEERRALLRGVASLAFAWCALALCGSVLFTRFDLAPAALLALAVALLATSSEWATACGAALGAAAALKLYPFWAAPALAMPLLRAHRLGRAIAAGLVAALLLSLPAMLPAGASALSFLGYHASRGVQLQSLWGSLWMVLGQLGFAHVELAHRFGAEEVTSAPSALGLIGTLLSIAWMFVCARVARSGPVHLAALCALCGFVAFGKIGSPQFSIVLAPLAAAALFDAPIAALTLLGSIALGAWQFPFHHLELTQNQGPWAAIGLIRMVLVAGAAISLALKRSSPRTR